MNQNKLVLEEVAKRLENFKDCKGLIIIGIEKDNTAKEEFIKINRMMKYNTDDIKMMAVEIKEKGACTYMVTRKVEKYRRGL